MLAAQDGSFEYAVLAPNDNTSAPGRPPRPAGPVAQTAGRHPYAIIGND